MVTVRDPPVCKVILCPDEVETVTSVVAPLVNVLILWLIPWIMVIGFFAVMFSYFFMPLGIVLSWIAYMTMEYIIRVVTFFAHIPFATFDFQIPIYAMIAGYAMLFIIMRKRRKAGSI